MLYIMYQYLDRSFILDTDLPGTGRRYPWEDLAGRLS